MSELEVRVEAGVEAVIGQEPGVASESALGQGGVSRQRRYPR